MELVCSILSLTTFLALFPWPRSGPAERNEVQVLIGTAVESLRQLLWNKGSSQGDVSDSHEYRFARAESVGVWSNDSGEVQARLRSGRLLFRSEVENGV